MAWEGSNRRQRLPANWKKIRQQVFRRDEYQCTWIEDDERCMGPAEECDHIRPGDDHRLSNLRSLCKPHHGLKSAREGAAARPKLAPRIRPNERHPGAI